MKSYATKACLGKWFKKGSLSLLGLIISFFMLTPEMARAQQFEVTGKVLTVDTNTPLTGVNVIEVGTQNGTSSNINGNFTLTVSSPDASLRFTYIGFEPQTVAINGENKLTVYMSEAIGELSEMVVTALGLERQQKSIGYAIDQVNTEQLIKATETNMANLLQGQVAGVNINAASGGPGSSSRVTIRGASSLAGNNQPLYVVDGIPIDNTNIGSAGEWGGFDGGDGLSNINSEDIESISVLKGAAAASLYGTRARDGVILITTKTGRGDQLDVRFNTTTTIDNALIKFTDYQNTYGQGTRGLKPQTVEEALQTGLSSWGAKLDGSQVIQFDGVARSYSNVGNRLDAFYRTAVSTRNAISISGGQENASYYFSTTYLGSESVVPNSSWKNLSMTLRGTTTIGKLKADVKANYINELANNRSWISDSPGNANYTITQLPPNVSPKTLRDNYVTEDGTEFLPTDGVFVDNPYWITNKFNTDDTKDRIIGLVKLDYNILDWLTLTGRTGLDWYSLRRTDLVPWGTAWRSGGQLTENQWRVLENNTDLILNASHAITSDITLSGTLGGNRRYNKSENVGNSGTEFKIPGLETISNLKNLSPIYSFSEKQVNSIYGAFEFNYQDYLFLNATGRNDWSSTLPEGDNSFFYPSVSVSFVFSEAFSSNMPSELSFGKIRASWAEVGSDTDPYMLNLTYSIFDVSHQGQPLGAIAQSSVPLANLKPTSTKEVELGTDIRFFDDRLGLDFTWYNRNTTDQILSTTISQTSGFTSRVINAGELNNHGIEFRLTTVPISRASLLWRSSLNFARNWSKVEALAGDQQVLQLGPSRTFTAWITAEVGQEYGTIWGYKYLRDNDGNIVFENGLPVQDPERAILGKGTPDWNAGWTNTLNYKNFQLNFLIDAKWGGQIFSATNANAYANGLHKNTLEGRPTCDESSGGGGYPTTGCFVADGVIVTERNPDTGEIVATRPNDIPVLPQTYYGRITGQIAEEFVYDANFIKMRQIGLSYQLPERVIQKLPLSSATVSIVGRNLFYIYNSVPNIDPESAINRGNAQGLELAGVPNTRSIGLSLDLRF